MFYESLCPDSMNFVSKHLVPQIDAFDDAIEVVLVPFGKSRVSTYWIVIYKLVNGKHDIWRES